MSTSASATRSGFLSPSDAGSAAAIVAALGIAATDIDVNGNKIVNVADPTNPQDLVTKAYLSLVYGVIANILFFTFDDTDAATITFDLTYGVHRVTLGGNRTFAFTLLHAAQPVFLIIKQDATGNRTATWPAEAHFVGTDATLSTGANKVDIYAGICDGADIYFHAVKKGF